MFQLYKRHERILLSTVISFFICIASVAAQTPDDAKTVYKEAEIRYKLLEGSYYFKLLIKLVTPERTTTELSEVFTAQTDGNTSYQPPMILLERNGKRLSDKKIEKQRKEAAKELAKYEEIGRLSGSSSSKTKYYPKSKSSQGDNFMLFNRYDSRTVDNMEFSDLHRETLDGRECFVFIRSVRADANFDYLDAETETKKREEWNRLFDFITWVDVADKQFSRMEVYPRGIAKQFIGKPVAERERVMLAFLKSKRTEDGRWLPEHIKTPRKDLIKITEYYFSDYKLFKTEVEDAKVDGGGSGGAATKKQ